MSAVEQQSADIERTPAGVTVRFERTFRRSRDEVWQALTEPARLSAWLDEALVELRLGGRFEIQFADGTMTGVITELVHERVLAYSWHEAQPGRSHVRWELSDADGGTLLRLEHTLLPDDSASGFAAGWHHHLERLESLLGGSTVSWSPERFDELAQFYSAPEGDPATSWRD